MSEPDSSLIAEFNARRSEEAFAALVRQHVNLVFATALRQVGDRGAAEEITQNVFVALAQAAGKLGSHPTIAGWLHQTALNKSREWLRSELRRHKREQVAVNLDLARAEGDSVWSPLVPLLDEALLKLREPDRQAVILHFLEGRTFQEVGSALDISEDTARKRVHRCLDQLVDFFQRKGFAVPTLAAGAPLFALSSPAAPAGLAAAATTAGLAAAHSAATSTLTLIKGALKIMAWTKAKTVVVAGVAILLTAGTATIVMKSANAIRRANPPDLQGAWEGVEEIRDASGIAKGKYARSRIVFRFFKTNGVYSATGEFIDTAPEPLQATRFTYDYPSVRLAVGRNTSFQGTLKSRATEISGTYRTRNFSAPMVLKRTATPAAAPEPLVASDYRSRAGSDLQGAWKATFGSGARAIRITIKISEPVSGEFRAELDNVTTAWLGQPVSVTYNPPEVKLLVASGAGMFQGELRNGNTEMAGDWIQGGGRTPVIFQRTGR
jgi:RNA polymerase sigma factor (sigma-70 family)